MKPARSLNCCYCEKPHGKSSPLIFQSCDACQADWDKRAADSSDGLITVSCPRCDLLFSADATPTLTDAEREALEIACEYVGSAFQVEHHAATLRGLLERIGGKR